MFKTGLQQFQFYDKYSRFNAVLARKETWEETVDRACNYLFELGGDKLFDWEKDAIKNAIVKMDVMPSMRLMAMAGKAARRNNACIYNCAYLPIQDLFAFAEVLQLCMSGVGLGFSVELDYIEGLPVIEKQATSSPALEHIQGLPTIEKQVAASPQRFVIPDSTEGWVQAFYMGLQAWYAGTDVVFDYSHIRPNGAILKTKGGRASGPEPLRDLLDFTRELILGKQGQRLSSIDVYDIVCKVGDCVIMGGVRRVAFLCLFSFNDHQMLHAKDGDFWNDRPWRGNSNNSRVIEKELDRVEVAKLFEEMDNGNNGEPGIFSRIAVQNTLPERRVYTRFGTNACGEVILRPFEFCNLSSVVCSPTDTRETLIVKAKLATLIGTLQSLAIDFKGLRPEWEINAKEERLLGVDLNGQMDCAIARDADVQNELRNVALQANLEYAERFGINPSAGITAVKPSGNSGVLLGASSGIHARWAKHYIRNVTVNEGTTLYKLFLQTGVPMIHYAGTKWLVSFYEKSPENAITRHDLNALQQLNYWKQVKSHYTEHNPSCTIYYRKSEMLQIIDWLYENQSIVGGLSFFPTFDAVYENAPYIEITKEEYEQAEKPIIDFSQISKFEVYDYTGAGEFACTSGQCDFQL